jgi:hypothetical protein
MTPSHSHHITARYGLFTLILLVRACSPQPTRSSRATPRQLELFGFPPPGHPYWNMDTFTGMEQRYPQLELRPRRAPSAHLERPAQSG